MANASSKGQQNQLLWWSCGKIRFEII